MYKEIIEKLISVPQKEQIKIDFDLNKKTFRLSAPIFSSKRLSEKIKQYVRAREKLTFSPHATSYEIQGETVLLIQEIPFALGVQETTRKGLHEFLNLSRFCCKMLSEIEIEDRYKSALHLRAW